MKIEFIILKYILNNYKVYNYKTMSSDPQFKTALNNIISTVTTNQKILDEVKADNAMVVESLTSIYQMVEDISKKLDEVLNIGIKKPKGTTTKSVNNSDEKSSSSESVSSNTKQNNIKNKNSESKDDTGADSGKVVIKNIMTFFKTRYTQDPSIFNDILEENQAESIFAEHAKEILAKKEGVQRNKFKASLLYKQTTKTQRKKIRDKMMDENDSASINNDDDVEEADESS